MRAPFTIREHVRWADVDPAGIIRYDAYTRFFELAESELFRSLGVPYREVFRRFQVSMPRRVMHIDYHTPPMLDDELTVRAYVTRMGTTSLTMQFDVYGTNAHHDNGVARASSLPAERAESVLRADGHLVLVCVDVEGRMRKRAWPDALRVLLEPFVMSKDEARSR